MPFLNWVNKDQAMQAINAVDYRLLNFNAGYGDANPNNMLIQGDNLEALRALMPYYAGQVKCIYIDPPYNTQSAFAHFSFDDVSMAEQEFEDYKSKFLTRLRECEDAT